MAVFVRNREMLKTKNTISILDTNAGWRFRSESVIKTALVPITMGNYMNEMLELKLLDRTRHLRPAMTTHGCAVRYCSLKIVAYPFG